MQDLLARQPGLFCSLAGAAFQRHNISVKQTN